jgi:hypothetical protein
VKRSRNIMCVQSISIGESMEHNFGAFLVSQYWQQPCVHAHSASNDRVAVIVETRDAFFLPLVIANAVDKLGPAWNLHVVAPTPVLMSLREKLPDCEFACTPLACPTKISTSQYSALLRRPSFWHCFKEEHILIFQLDVVMLREVPRWAEEYDYIGAPCGSFDEDFVLNGGLSLRKKSAMLRHCQDDALTESEPEDIYFTRVLRAAGAHLPNLKDAARFACESIYDAECCGVHGTHHYFLAPEQVAEIFRHNR